MDQGEDDDHIEIMYEIERIINKRNRNGSLQYQVKWKGYVGKHAKTWEPKNNLAHIPELLYEYEQNAKKINKSNKHESSSHQTKGKAIQKPAKGKEARKVLKINLQNKSSNRQQSRQSFSGDQQINISSEGLAQVFNKDKGQRDEECGIIVDEENKRIKITREYPIEQRKSKLFQERRANIYIDEVNSIEEIKKIKEKWFVLISFKLQKYPSQWQDRNIIRLLHPQLLLEYYEKLIHSSNKEN